MSIFSGVNNPGLDFEQFTALEVEVLEEIAGLPPPGADRILFFDESATSYNYLTVGSGLSITGTSLTTDETVGSFSPTITSATMGDLSVAYTATRVGSYIKTGRLVTANVFVQFTPTYTTAAGALRVSLPFTPTVPFSFSPGTINAIDATYTFPAGYTNVLAYSNSPSQQYAYLYRVGSGVAGTNMLITNLTSGTRYSIAFSLTYIA